MVLGLSNFRGEILAVVGSAALLFLLGSGGYFLLMAIFEDAEFGDWLDELTFFPAMGVGLLCSSLVVAVIWLVW